VIAVIIQLLITFRIIVGMRRQCEGGGSRKHGMSLECELGDRRAFWFVYGKVCVQTGLEGCTDCKRGHGIRDI
jgi:hypothetical protein